MEQFKYPWTSIRCKDYTKAFKGSVRNFTLMLDLAYLMEVNDYSSFDCSFRSCARKWHPDLHQGESKVGRDLDTTWFTLWDDWKWKWYQIYQCSNIICNYRMKLKLNSNKLAKPFKSSWSVFLASRWPYKLMGKSILLKHLSARRCLGVLLQSLVNGLGVGELYSLLECRIEYHQADTRQAAFFPQMHAGSAYIAWDFNIPETSKSALISLQKGIQVDQVCTQHKCIAVPGPKAIHSHFQNCIWCPEGKKVVIERTRGNNSWSFIIKSPIYTIH